ncbi:MAG: UvrB/UvrC motif-containing protein [Acutalibacter sp.]
MKAAAKLLEFEHAAYLRDKIKELEGSGPLPGQKRRLPKP